MMRFEALAKLAQQWSVHVPLGMHLEPIDPDIIIINRAMWAEERTVQCQIRSSLGQWWTI